jgi:hypothetical protein
MNNSENPIRQNNRNFTGVAVALGIGIGTAIGVASNNITLWVALGAAFGMFLNRCNQ